MPNTKLTDRSVRAAKPPATGRMDILDTGEKGLVLRVTPNGVKSWSIRYTVKGKGQRRASYGTYPAVTLADARQRARDIVAAAGKGIDLPADEAASRASAATQAGRPATVADLVTRYVADYCKPNQRRWKLSEALFNAHVVPAIGDVALSALRRADVVEMLTDLQTGKGFRAQVNRVRSQVKAMLDWAVVREWIAGNPATGIKKAKGLEAPRNRTLSDDELRRVWRAADRLPSPSGALVKMLVLTGARRDEVRAMEWSEVSTAARTWTLPAARNKGKRDHLVPLSDAAMTLLEAVPRVTDRETGEPSPWVFTTDGAKPYNGMKRLKAILDRDSGVTSLPWVLHDIRRTVRTGLARLGVAEEVAEHVMNHARPGLVKTYNLHDYEAEKRDALARWAAHVLAIAADNVIPLPVRA